MNYNKLTIFTINIFLKSYLYSVINYFDNCWGQKAFLRDLNKNAYVSREIMTSLISFATAYGVVSSA